MQLILNRGDNLHRNRTSNYSAPPRSRILIYHRAMNGASKREITQREGNFPVDKNLPGQCGPEWKYCGLTQFIGLATCFVATAGDK